MPIVQEELDDIGMVLINHTLAEPENIVTLTDADNNVHAVYYRYYVGLNLALKVICVLEGKQVEVQSAYWLEEEEYKDEIGIITE